MVPFPLTVPAVSGIDSHNFCCAANKKLFPAQQDKSPRITRQVE